MTTIVLTHPNERCPRFQVFGIYHGFREQRTFALQEVVERDEAERIAKKMMEDHEADHFHRVLGKT